jgi:type IV pili sensor histidine kinase/response regulator
VVDDEPMLRALCTMLLADWGFRVLEARDGQEAWELLQRASASFDAGELAREQNVIDAVLLDVNMPRLRGDALLVQLRRAYPGLPVIMMSSEADDVRNRVLSLGASSFLVKPFRPAELESHLTHALETPLALPQAAMLGFARAPEQLHRSSSAR